MTVSYETAEAIRQKKAQYCRFVDERRWEDIKPLVAPRVDFLFLAPDGSTIAHFETVDEFTEQTGKFLDRARSSHRVANSELREISETQVEAIWAMEDYIVFPAREDNPTPTMHGYGHYYEVWELSDGEWRMSSLKLVRQIIDEA
ncbi:nuclear transport factor 2 family protein [Saccharopolyspora sp. K220]|uniref:nuclear transport factor 2 family protein n=1 Tax=Saccharopolyspora soli TaxID=2926618 RepID=UPI001F585616|nr:nuclear transport factor 2 family protein [Saccharopolyspora soli]MCI2424095.1 nuclear transport factor 2 family protein [Saccharopolyspora soli]